MAFFQYFNGEIFPIEESVFKTNDLGLLRGFGMFDYFRTYNGIPFRWDDYWSRFENSAGLLKIKLDITQDEVAKILAELHARCGEPDVAFRFVLTGGYAPDSVNVVKPNFLIRTEGLPKDDMAGRVAGIKVLPYAYVRDLPEVKTTNYVHMVLMAEAMRAAGAVDLLYHQKGEVSELTRSNLFIFKGNKLITPNQMILKGVTRKVVMELSSSLFEVEERPVLLDEVLFADEVFTTSTTKLVTPIIQIGDYAIGDGKAGKRTILLQKLLISRIENWGNGA